MLKELSDKKLHSQLLMLVKEERTLLAKIISHLEEVNRRRLYSDYGCRSIFDYCVKILKYPESQAYRRLNAMKLSKEIPEIKNKIEEGKLTLTVITSAVKFFKSEKNCNTQEKKKVILAKIENQNSRQVERTLAKLSSRPKQVMNQIEISDETKNSLDLIRAEMAHKNPYLSYDELIQILAQKFLSEDNFSAPRKSRVKTKRLESVKAKKTSQTKCGICSSTWALEVDHIKPKSLGGSNEPENLRILCRNCHQRQAIRKLGMKTMQNYLK